VTWTEEMHNLVMKLAGEQKGENGTVSTVAWKQIALAMSAKEWTSSGGGTHKPSFTWEACRSRYSKYKGAFEESTGAKVRWTEEMHILMAKLAGERMVKNGSMTGAAWKQIALAMSAKEWETSKGGTHKLSFTAMACKSRYKRHKGAHTRADNIHSIPTISSH
jgi:hypothetical protein